MYIYSFVYLITQIKKHQSGSCKRSCDSWLWHAHTHKQLNYLAPHAFPHIISCKCHVWTAQHTCGHQFNKNWNWTKFNNIFCTRDIIIKSVSAKLFHSPHQLKENYKESRSMKTKVSMDDSKSKITPYTFFNTFMQFNVQLIFLWVPDMTCFNPQMLSPLN